MLVNRFAYFTAISSLVLRRLVTLLCVAAAVITIVDPILEDLLLEHDEVVIARLGIVLYTGTSGCLSEYGKLFAINSFINCDSTY